MRDFRDKIKKKMASLAVISILVLSMAVESNAASKCLYVTRVR